MKYIISDIEYDEGHDDLPKTLTMTLDRELHGEELQHEVSEFISNETGFCHKGFNVEMDVKPVTEGLLPFIVLYTDGNFTVPEGSLFMAEDSDHAEDQMESENPDANITWVVQTDDINHAFEVYHKESSMEDCD